MPAPATIDAFLEVLGRSGLVEPGRLHQFLRQAGGLSSAPRKLAARLVAAGLLTQFQAEQLLLGKHRGFTIGKYKVLERIGTGGHSTVYLGEHLTVKRRVAIKVLPTAKASNPTAIARFYREARAAGALDHPNLVKAHDVDQENGLHFLVMDYVDGSSLQEIVSRIGALPPARAAHYVRQAAQGLQAAHAAGLVHRDIKPANILLDRGGVIRVLDLGLARFFSDNDDPLTLKLENNIVLGTADYVAPEQALNSHDVDIRADIYSLGATFYFLLTGHPLFPNGKIAQKLIWHQTRQPTPIRQLRPEVPEELAVVLARMIDKNPARRQQTPLEVIEALAPWTEEPVLPPAEVEMPRLSPALRGAAVAEAESGSDLPAGPRPSARPNRSVVSLATPPGHGTPDGGESGPGGRPLRPLTMAEMPTPPIPAGLVETNIDAPALPASLPVPVRAAEPETPALNLRARASQRWKEMPRASKKRLLLTILCLTIGVFTGVAARWMLKPATPKAEAMTPVLIVSHSPQHYASLAAALAAAPPNARIVVRESTWEEALRLTGDGSPARAVRIEGQSPTGAAVDWRPPRGHPADQPLVQIAEGVGVQLKSFTLDGEDRVQNLIAAAGPSAGLTLEDLHLRGFQENGLVLRHCTGTLDLPVTLQRLRVVAGRAAVSALTLEAGDGESNRHVRVVDCRLEGPYQSAVRLRGSTMDVELRRNRLFNAVDGIVCVKTNPPVPVELTLASNTFCDIEKIALHFEALPPPDHGRIVLTSNLFARTGILAQVDDFRPQPLQTKASWIWSAEPKATNPRPPDAPAEKRFFRKRFSVAEAAVGQALLNVTGDAAFTVWLNGERVGQGGLNVLTQVGDEVFRTSTRRVYAFDAAHYLRPGENVLAIEGNGPAASGGILAELTYAARGAAPTTLVSDATWRVFRTDVPGWTLPGGDDTLGEPAVVAVPYGGGPAAWRNLVWDCVLQERFQGRVDRPFPEPSGNVCDENVAEGFPLLKAMTHRFELPTDVNDDARFLRYPSTSLLKLAGTPGVPPAEKDDER